MLSVVSLSLLFVMTLAPAFGQTTTLRGVVPDPSGAVVSGAMIKLTGPSGPPETAKSKDDGTYSFPGLAPGEYTVQASALNLALPQPVKVEVKSGLETLNLQLQVVMVTQEVSVQGSRKPALSTESAGNASALLIRGED